MQRNVTQVPAPRETGGRGGNKTATADTSPSCCIMTYCEPVRRAVSHGPLTTLALVLCAMLPMRPLAANSPLVSLLCTDELMCSRMATLGGTRPILSVSISVDAPFASSANVTLWNPSLPLSSTQFDAVVLTISTGFSTSTTTVFLAILAAEAKAEETLGRNSSAWLVAAELLPAVDLASSNLGKPFLAVPFTAIDGVASSLSEKLAPVMSSSNFLGTVSYALGSTAYLTGSIAAELSITGSLALITGPYREPSVSFHAYVRAALHRRCPTCVLMATYQPPKRMSSAAALLDYSRTALPRSVDVIIVEMPIEPFREFKRLVSAEPRFAKATLLCVACSGGLLNITFLDTPIYTALTTTKQRRSSSPLVNSSVALFYGHGLSVSVCLACLPIRAQRTFADEFAHAQTLYELHGQVGVRSLVDLPLVPSPLDMPLTTSPWVYSWTNDPSVVAIPNTNGANAISVTPVTAVASNCGLFRAESSVDCALLSFSPNVRNVTTLNVILGEWTSQSILFIADSSVTSWLDDGNGFPDGEFSVDAVGSAGFLVFGGYRATQTSVPLPLDDLLLLTPQGDQPAAVTTVLVHHIARGTDSSSAPWPSARSNHAHVATGSGNDVVLYIHGGRGTGGVIYSDLWRFHFLSRKWTQLTSSGEPRYGHSMLWMPRFSDPVLVIVGGNNLFAISSVIHYSVNRSVWFPAVELAVASTSCSVPLDPIHIAFLSRNFHPCVLDILSLQVACHSQQSASTTATLNGVSAISGVFCEGVHALSTRKTTVGVAVIPKNALSTASTWLEVFSVPACPPTRLSNASDSENTVNRLHSDQHGDINVGACQGYCAEQQFPYGGTCVPCNLDATSSWSWTNISLTSDAFVQAAAAAHPACNIPTAATDSSGTIAFSVVLVVVFFVGGSVLGYVVWNNVFDSGDDRNCAKAPAVIPLTLLFVDIHLSTSCWIHGSTNHAKFVDLFAHSVRDATIRVEGAYKVRNVGDGVLLACQNAVDGLRLLQTIRSLMRRSLKHFFLSGGTIELPASDCLLSDDDGSPLIRGVRVVPEIEHRQEHIDAHLNRIKFAFHTTACVDIRRTPSTVYYEGEETLFPVFASHQTRAGEVAFTLDTVAELQEAQRTAIADGAHLRKGKKDNQIRQSTLNNVVHLLGEFDPGDMAVISPVTAAPPVFDRCPDTKRTRERICFRGIHIRTVKSALLDTNKIQTTGEGEATPAESPFPSLVHTKVTRQRSSWQRQSSSTPISTLRGSNTHCPSTAVLTARSLVDYLDDTDLTNHHVTHEEFEAMTHLITASLHGVFSSLTREDLSDLLKRIDLSFALGHLSFPLRPMDVCSTSTEAVSGQTMEILQLIAARVLQMIKPATAKHQLKRCAKAGKRAADMGVAEASGTC